MFYSVIHLRWFPSRVNNLKFHLHESRMAPGGSQGKGTLIRAKWLPFAVKETNLHAPFHLFCCGCIPKLCPTPCDPMNCSTPGSPVLLHLPEVLKLMSIESVMPSNHLILCCPLLFLPSIFPSIRVFYQWVSSSHQVAKVLELQLQHRSFQWIFRTDFL